jgi:hypothetical protein
MLASLLRLLALRPILAASIFGIPVLLVLAAGLASVWLVKLALMLVPVVIAIWLVRSLLRGMRADANGHAPGDARSV